MKGNIIFLCFLFSFTVSILFVSGQLKKDSSFVTKNIKGECAQPLLIQNIAIKDTLLIQVLRQFIQEKKITDTAFVKIGYVTIIYGRNKLDNEDVARSYTLIKKYYPYSLKLDSDNIFPQYYSFVDGKLIEIQSFLIGEVICQKISRKSKRKYIRIVNRYVVKPKRIRAKDENGKVMIFKNYREYTVEFHKAWELFILKNKPSVLIKH